MEKDRRLATCPECGAATPIEAGRCQLCGSELVSVSSLEDEQQDQAPLPLAESEETQSAPGDLTCPTCGRINRADAIFCDQCATPVGKESASRKRPQATQSQQTARRRTDRPKAGSGRASGKRTTAPAQDAAKKEPKPRIGALLAGGVVVVAVLYGATVMTKSDRSTRPPAVPVNREVSGDLSSFLSEDPELASQAEELRSAAEQADDPARQMALRSQLVELYAGNGRLDLAGREQDALAEIDNTAASWALAGNLHFDWMEQQSGTERVKSAQRAAASYNKSLELDPENLDVRTDLGVAYLNDPASPMLAIRETNAVLDVDPDHVQANFNKGVMLIQIGRADEAVALFERVLELTDQESPAYQRATEILEQLRSANG